MSLLMPRAVSSFFASFAPMVCRPFQGLWVLTLIYFAWCFMVYPHSQTMRGNLPDPDDYMYLTQMIDWLNGQGWYDNIQHRMNPPTGVPIHFSRFAMLPMAIVTLALHHLGLGWRGAATVMAFFEPLVLFGLLFITMKWIAEAFMSASWSGVSAFVTLFATGMTFMFMPGHVDHHNMIIVIVAFALGCILRMIQNPEQLRWGVYAGLALAFGLMVALEILPWLLVIAVFIGLWAMVRGGNAARSSMIFGITLYLASLVFLALTRPPQGWREPDVLTYSVVYVFLTGGIALSFVGVGITARAPLWARFTVGSLLGLASGLVFLHYFPALVTGPYGGMDPELAEQILGEIDEAQPLTEIDHSVFALLYHTAGAVIGLGAAMAFWRRARREETRWLWGAVMTLLASSLVLTVFYQRRFTGMMGMFSIVPLTALLAQGWEWIGCHYEGRRKIWAEIFLVLLVGPLPSVFFTALVDGRAFNTGVFLFPVDNALGHNPCDTYILEKILRDPHIYGDKPRLIMSSMGLGPELLFRTPHQILAAPFHMNVTGNIDATRFFSTPYTTEAEAIARRRGVDLVVSCRYIPEIYLRSPISASIRGGEKPKDFAPHLVEQLVTNRPPAWLKQVNFKGLDNFVIYEVLPPAGDKPVHGKSRDTGSGKNPRQKHSQKELWGPMSAPDPAALARGVPPTGE